MLSNCRSQWPRDLMRRSAADRLLRSWFRIPPRAWIFVCCECCVLSGRGLCDELITHPEESYRLWWVVVCDLETSRMRRPWPALGRSATAKKNKKVILRYYNQTLLLFNICFVPNTAETFLYVSHVWKWMQSRGLMHWRWLISPFWFQRDMKWRIN